MIEKEQVQAMMRTIQQVAAVAMMMMVLVGLMKLQVWVGAVAVAAAHLLQ